MEAGLSTKGDWVSSWPRSSQKLGSYLGLMTGLESLLDWRWGQGCGKGLGIGLQMKCGQARSQS
jgi:hypothetical protein